MFANNEKKRPKNTILSFFLIISLCNIFSCSVAQKNSTQFNQYKLEGLAQGTSYHISYYAAGNIISRIEIDSLFTSLDNSLSIYKPNSLINKFNNSDFGIEMDEHLYKVVQLSLKIWKESDGVFDISILPIVEAWGFGVKKHSNQPSDDEITRILLCTGSDKLHIKGRQLIKDTPCLKIDVNGIAQGYSVDVIASYIESKGINNYLIEIGGEIRVKGRKQPGNQIMRIGIEQPAENSNDETVVQEVIEVKGGAITTSGNYRKFVQNGSKKLSHLMNPKTGHPIENEMISVTVRTKNAMSADGYDNVLIGMGLEKAFAFLKKHKGLEAYFIFRKPDGMVADTASVGFFRE